VRYGSYTYIKAKCRPTMRKDPPFYSLFVRMEDGKLLLPYNIMLKIMCTIQVRTFGVIILSK